MSSNTNSAKKSRSKRVESEGNEDRHNSTGNNQVSLGTDSSQPDSARRRDPRKRMKKTISAKEYETANMDSQNNSKVDESLGVNNKQDGQMKGMYNQIEFQSINGLSESTLPNDHQQFQLGQQKQQQLTGSTSNSSSSYNNQGQKLNNQNYNNNNNFVSNNIPNSTTISINNGYQEQQQTISSPTGQLGGAVGLQKHVINIDNVDQNSDSEYDETSSSWQCIQRIKSFLKVLLPFIYLSVLVVLTVCYSYQFQTEEQINQDLPETQIIVPSQKDQKNDLILHGIISLITQQAAEQCGIVKSELKRILNQKNSLFQVDLCSWRQSCADGQLVIGGFCVEECPKGTVKSTRKATMCQISSEDQCPVSMYLSQISIKKDDDNNYIVQSLDCQDCSENCFSCQSSEICQACDERYFLSNGKCVRSCEIQHNPTWLNFTKSHQQLCTNGFVNRKILNNQYQIKYIYSEILKQRVYYEIINKRQNPDIVAYYIHSSSDSFLDLANVTSLEKNMDRNDILDTCIDCTIVVIHTLADGVEQDILKLFVWKELIMEVEGETGLQRGSTRAIIGDGKVAGEIALKIAKDNRPYLEFGFIGVINSMEIVDVLPVNVNIPTKLCVQVKDDKEKEQMEAVRGRRDKKSDQLEIEIEIGLKEKDRLDWIIQKLNQFKEESLNSKNN